MAWSAIGDLRRAKRILERQLRDDGSGSSVVDAVVLFGAAIDAWGKSGEVDRGVRAEALLDRLVEMVGRRRRRRRRRRSGDSALVETTILSPPHHHHHQNSSQHHHPPPTLPSSVIPAEPRSLPNSSKPSLPPLPLPHHHHRCHHHPTTILPSIDRHSTTPAQKRALR